jgi:hypothetical protein
MPCGDFWSTTSDVVTTGDRGVGSLIDLDEFVGCKGDDAAGMPYGPSGLMIIAPRTVPRRAHASAKMKPRRNGVSPGKPSPSVDRSLAKLLRGRIEFSEIAGLSTGERRHRSLIAPAMVAS